MSEELQRSQRRREFLKKAASGTVIVAIGGGVYRLLSDDLNQKARAERRPDGKSRLPPGQRIIETLKPMGGEPGSARTEEFRLKVHGLVKTPFELDWNTFQKMPQRSQGCDVHCVTGWSVLGAIWNGVPLMAIAERAGVLPTARHVILEGAHGYTANIPLRDALKPNVLLAHEFQGKRLTRNHGAPVRGLVPDLYFWKGPKWVTGVRFVERDEPGYWEVRGYHNHADPWLEERYG